MSSNFISSLKVRSLVVDDLETVGRREVWVPAGSDSYTLDRRVKTLVLDANGMSGTSTLNLPADAREGWSCVVICEGAMGGIVNITAPVTGTISGAVVNLTDDSNATFENFDAYAMNTWADREHVEIRFADGHWLITGRGTIPP